MHELLYSILKALVLCAGVGNCFALSLQLRSILAKRSAKGVSTAMFFCFVLFQCIYAINGVVEKDYFVTISMTMSMMVTMVIIIMAYKIRKSEQSTTGTS